MRTININNEAMNIVGTASIPDAVCYVFNPNYIDISLVGYNDVLTIEIAANAKTYEVEVSLFNGKAKCYISKLMQLHFEDYISTRSLEMSISIKTQSGDLILAESTMALWAYLDLGMKLGYYLPFTYDKGISPKHIREVVWFKNFPFRISLFRHELDFAGYGKSDNNDDITIYEGSRAFAPSDNSVLRPGTTAYDEFYNKIGNMMEAPANRVVDTRLFREAGLEIDLEQTGITHVSQLSDVALKNVVVRSIIDADIKQFYMNDFLTHYVRDGFDIITYWSLYGGKTGIFELTPQVLFPNTDRHLVLTIMKTIPSEAVFDANFDIVFNEITSVAYIVKLIVCNDIDGIYLRWIDQYGFWQYFLFAEGKRTSKNKLSSIMVNAEYEKDGIYHEAMRNIHIDNTDTIKCCAVNLRREILAYVETIYKSPHVEMYIGLDFEQNEMWKPVNIVAGSVDIEANQRLFDYEVSITLPDTASQTI